MIRLLLFITMLYPVLGWANSFVAPTRIEGVSPGDTYQRVIQQWGTPMRCSTRGSTQWCAWENEDELFVTVGFVQQRVDYLYVSQGYSAEATLPFDSVIAMRQLLGQEDVYSISENRQRTRYTYLASGLTVNFDDAELIGYGIGQVGWRASGTVSEYWVQGRQICPSDRCPFELPTNTPKPEFAGASVWDLIR